MLLVERCAVARGPCVRFLRPCVFASVLALLWIAGSVPRADGQDSQTFKVRLAPVAIDAAMKSNIAGSGAATAVLTGSRFTVRGSFEGLKSPATAAHIYQGTAPGVRGAPLLDLKASHATAGTISGDFELNADQIARLKKGDWYIQIDSEKAPAGNLWGWLFNR
jgi:hypothetical protein